MTLLDDMTAARGPWTSARLRDWYPGPEGDALLRAATAAEADRVGDAEFGAAFRDGVAAVPVPDPLAWANRRIDLPGGGWCVAGIRFRGLDVTRPFVDVVATTAPPTAADLATVCRAVVPRFAEFAPRAVRVDAPDPDALVAAAAHGFAGAEVDLYTVAGLVEDLRARPALPGQHRVSLRPVSAAVAHERVVAVFADLAAERPDLGEWAVPSTVDDLADCAEEGLLFEVCVDGDPHGVVASRRDDDHGLSGFVVEEIVLDAAARGRGLAPAIHRHLAAALPAAPGDTLWGSIHPDNTPSLRTAHATGREIVGGHVWLVPHGLPGFRRNG